MRHLYAQRIIAAEVVGVVVEHLTDPRDGEPATGIVVSVNSYKHVRMEVSYPLSGGRGREGGRG